MIRLVVAGLRVVLAAVFIYAGVAKVTNPARFASDIGNFHILPWPAAAGLAFYLPWLEMLAGAAMLVGRCERGAALILLALSVVFLAAITSAKVRGIDVSCGCFGHSMPDLSFVGHLLLNAGMAAAAGAVLVLRPTPAR